MSNLRFEWGSRKAKANLEKHGITFKETKTAFLDESAMVHFDPDYSEDEGRFILLGTSHQLNQVVVCHCFRQEENIVRIISARKADASESRNYWENRK